MTSRRHIVVVSGYWPSETNSISGIFVVQQIAALLRAGCKVTVIVPVTIGRSSPALCSLHDVGLDSTCIELVQVRIPRLPERLSSLPGALWLNSRLNGLAMSESLRKLASFGRYDGCIVHGVRYAGLSLPWWRKWIHGRAVVVMHGVEPFFTRRSNERRARPLLSAACNAVESVVLVGTPLAPHAQSLGIPEGKLRTIANGTDLPMVRSLSMGQRTRRQRRRIVSVSNLEPLKGIDHNLSALAQISVTRTDLDWEYRIVGDGTFRRDLEAMVEALGMAGRVRFLGRLSYGETMREIDDADIFSLPSWGEAFGIVYLEAMARMKPVIGCLENGPADFVKNEEDGLLIPPHSLPHLTNALERLIERPDFCERLGCHARISAEKYTWDENAKRVLAELGLGSASNP